MARAPRGREGTSGADSTIRRAVKRLLFPLMPVAAYRAFQALVKAWDIRRGAWYEPEIDLVRLGLKPGETALDIGANFGMYTYHLSRAAGEQGRVFAFEPVPFTAATLRIVSRLLRITNARIVEKGCGERNERVTFRIPVQSSGALSAGLAHFAARNDDRIGKETQVRWDRTTTIGCDVVTLDDYLDSSLEVSFIKCDVEGAEFHVFRGAKRLLDAYLPTVLLEINPWYIEGLGIRLADLTGLFVDRGYRLYRYDVLGGVGQLLPTKESEIIERNYVFAHPRHLDRFRSVLKG